MQYRLFKEIGIWYESFDAQLLGKNERFLQDFKTLADVLIQEVLKTQLRTYIPGLEKDCVHGEEDNEFTNSKGETVLVKIGPQPSDTFELLKRAFDNNKEAWYLISLVKMCIIFFQRITQDMCLWNGFLRYRRPNYLQT